MRQRRDRLYQRDGVHGCVLKEESIRKKNLKYGEEPSPVHGISSWVRKQPKRRQSESLMVLEVGLALWFGRKILNVIIVIIYENVMRFYAFNVQ